MKVEPKVKTPVQIHADADVQKLVEENRGMVERLANVERIEFVRASLAQVAGARATPKFEVALVYEKKVDVAAERERLSKELKKLGFTFVGSTICYAFMQAVGMVNDHTVDCFRWQEVRDFALSNENST